MIQQRLSLSSMIAAAAAAAIMEERERRCWIMIEAPDEGG